MCLFVKLLYRYFTLEISRKLLVTQAMETTTGANNAIFILSWIILDNS